MTENESYNNYVKARQAMEKGDFPEAITLFQDSLNASPHFNTYELLGTCLIEFGRIQEAIEVLSRGTAHDPSRFKTWYLLGEAHLSGQQTKEALSCWHQSVSINPQYHAAQNA